MSGKTNQNTKAQWVLLTKKRKQKPLWSDIADGLSGTRQGNQWLSRSGRLSSSNVDKLARCVSLGPEVEDGGRLP